MLIITMCLGTIMVNKAADCVLLSAYSFQETDVCYNRLLLWPLSGTQAGNFQMPLTGLKCYFRFICLKGNKIQMGSLSCNSQICFCAWAVNVQLLFPRSLRLEYSPFRLMKQMELCTTIGICCPDAWKKIHLRIQVPNSKSNTSLPTEKKRWQ